MTDTGIIGLINAPQIKLVNKPPPVPYINAATITGMNNRYGSSHPVMFCSKTNNPITRRKTIGIHIILIRIILFSSQSKM